MERRNFLGRIRDSYNALLGQEEAVSETLLDPQATYFTWSSYDGEKNVGELGFVKKLIPNYHALSGRSWQSFLENDVTHDIIKKFVTWVIGKGLKLDADPDQVVLMSEGITLTDEEEDEFSKIVEARYRIFTNSEWSDYSKVDTFQKLSNEAFKSALLSGDLLVIDRYKGGMLSRQIIEGDRVITPLDKKFHSAAKARGNRIIDGVEINTRNEHIAYFVTTGILQTKRIPARNKRGFKTAYLVYGQKYKPGDLRGIPLVTAILETLKKMDRYKEAAVGSAEEREKIPFVIEHGVGSTGENPFQLKAAKAAGVKKADVEVAGNMADVKQTVSESYQKTVVNLPRAAKLSSIRSDTELNFPEFYKTLLRTVCATVEIPMEVALSWYDSNYSASRAALKDWEHTLSVNRAEFARQFYKPHYQRWLDLEILNNKVQAKGYLLAMQR